MKIHNRILRKNETGATAVYAAVVLALLLMFAALGVDVGYLYGVRNELHNAADAGALAGASKLFSSDGELTCDEAIAEATRITAANKTGNQDVVAGAVETGHWSFASRTFTASENTTQLEGWQEMSSSDLDGNPDFINAVRVQTQRSDTPSFFAKIIGFDSFFVNNDAVAWLGFPGTFQVDQPIAICKESIFDPADESYSCNKGRMINSGGGNTAAWTNFSQPCKNATPSTVKPYICGKGSPQLQAGQGLGTIEGETSSPQQLIVCWKTGSTYNGKEKAKNWNITLPVIECPGNKVGTCAKLVGAVNVNLIWIIEKQDPHYNDAPTEMTILNNDGHEIDSWSNSAPDGFTRWKDFVYHFKLANVNGPPVSDADYEEMYQNKNIFFLPTCEPQEILGGSGGENFGIMAAIPKLVE